MIEPLSSAEAIERIREIVSLGDVRTTVHCRKRMAERGFSFQDLLSILLHGEIKSRPEYDETHDHYKYRVDGITLDGDAVVAVTVIVSIRAVLVVTIF